MSKQQQLLRYILPFLLGTGIFIFLVAKAKLVQISVDEAYTLTILTKESVWNLVSYKDSYTNNHILHSLLCKLSFAIFGMDQMAGRLPILLSFILYFWFIWQFSRRFFKDDFVSFMFITVMVGNPYLLDFFSLARGYGLAISLMMTSIYFAARYILEGYKRGLAISQAFAILSVYAQFALLHFYLGLNLVILIFEINKFLKTKNRTELLRGMSAQFLSAFVLAILIYAPFKAIMADNQIRYYGSKNLWDDSIVSLITHSTYGVGYFSDQTVTVFKNLTVLLFALLIFNFYEKIRSDKLEIIKNNKKLEANKIKIKNNESLLTNIKIAENDKNLLLTNNKLLIKNNELLIRNNELLLIPNLKNNQLSTINEQYNDPSVFSFGLLLATFFAIVAQFYLFGTQYIVDRTALFLYPLIAINLPTVATMFARRRIWAGHFVAIILTVFCTWHIIRSGNLTFFQDWWFDKNTLEVIEDMKKEYQKRQTGKPLKLHTHCILEPAFHYYRDEQHLDWLIEPFLWDNKPDTINHYDFYYDYDDELPILQSKYEIVKKYDGGEFILFKPKSPPQ